MSKKHTDQCKKNVGFLGGDGGDMNPDGTRAAGGGGWGTWGTIGLDNNRPGNTLLSDNRSHVSVTVWLFSCVNSRQYLASGV